MSLTKVTYSMIDGAAANVKDFGAVGDGVTDDSAAIQLAFDQGGSIYLPDGTYFVTKAGLEALPDFGLKPANNSTIVFSGNAWIKLESGVDVRHIVAGVNCEDVTLISPKIDGNNSFANGIGFSGAKRFHVTDAQLKNFKSVPQLVSPALGGGRAITFQYNCDQVVINGVTATNCFTAVDVVGKITGPSRAIAVSNVVAINCNLVISALATDSDGPTTDLSELNTSIVEVNGVSFYNCGSSVGAEDRVEFSFTRQNSIGNAFPWMSPARTGTTFSSQDWLMSAYNAGNAEWNPASTYNIGDTVKYTDDGTNSCLFAVDQTSGVSISGVRGYNDTAYGKIGAIFRGLMKNVSFSDVVVSVDTAFIFRNGPVPVLTVTTRSFGAGQNIKIFDVDNLGTTDYIVGSDGPIGVANPLVPLYLQMENIGINETGNLGLVRSEMGTIVGGAATMWIQARNIYKGGFIAGSPFQLANRSIADCNSTDAGGFKSVYAGGLLVKQHQTNNQIRLERTGTNAGVSDLYANNNGLNCSTTFFLPNAAWDGSLLRLGAYRLWVDATGKLRIKDGDVASDTDGTVVGTQT